MNPHELAITSMHQVVASRNMKNLANSMPLLGIRSKC
ncbi:MAG: hypothetical protein RI928_496 [Pseudomonadota bacterium]|jgi:hypothetical protein